MRWDFSPAITGGGDTRTTHINIKPFDAGLVTVIQIYTDRRLYSIKLVSTQTQWTPKTAFRYSSGTSSAAWNQDQAGTLLHQAAGAGGSAAGPSVNAANLSFYEVSGDNPSWKPLRAYTDGHKTYIEFPETMDAMAAPVLVGLANDGSWFSSATQQVVQYRAVGTRFVADQVLDKFAVVRGVGSSQERLTFTRRK